MLANISYSGFTTMEADELYFVNGGSGSWGISGECHGDGQGNWGASITVRTPVGTGTAYIGHDENGLHMGIDIRKN